MDDLDHLQERIDFPFNDETLLAQALTHRSYLNENPAPGGADNERLEFLGDALLDFIVAEHIYRRYPGMSEGQLTSLRSGLVKEKSLAHFARELALGRYMYMGRGEAASGGADRAPLLCGAFEALIGAIYLDQGMEAAQGFVLRFVEPAAEAMVAEQMLKDAKSRLQEWSQGEWQLTPAYRTVSQRGPDHDREFTVEVLIGGRAFGIGIGRSKQIAEQEAARDALLRRGPVIDGPPDPLPIVSDLPPPTPDV
jgi:ribonuclease III